MGRKIRNRIQKTTYRIIGEGITEQYYFDHLKKCLKLNYKVSPRFFNNTSIDEMKKAIKKSLDDGVNVICVFDEDVSKRETLERKKLNDLVNKYRNNKSVLLCGSLQSIEYWFLIHYKQIRKEFINSKKTEEALKRYIPNYEKKKKFLEKDKWVINLCSDNKLKHAIDFARLADGNSGSRSDIYKIFDILEAV